MGTMQRLVVKKKYNMQHKEYLFLFFFSGKKTDALYFSKYLINKSSFSTVFFFFFTLNFHLEYQKGGSTVLVNHSFAPQ